MVGHYGLCDLPPRLLRVTCGLCVVSCPCFVLCAFPGSRVLSEVEILKENLGSEPYLPGLGSHILQ